MRIKHYKLIKGVQAAAIKGIQEGTIKVAASDLLKSMEQEQGMVTIDMSNRPASQEQITPQTFISLLQEAKREEEEKARRSRDGDK